MVLENYKECSTELAIDIQIIRFTMKRIVPIIISIFALSISNAIGQTPNQTTSEDTIKSFLTKMYNDKLYEDYDFLQKHCSPELLKKLQDAPKKKAFQKTERLFVGAEGVEPPTLCL